MEIENVRRLRFPNRNSELPPLPCSLGSFPSHFRFSLVTWKLCHLQSRSVTKQFANSKSSYSGNSDRNEALRTAHPWQPWPAISPLVGIRKLVKYLAIKLLQQNFGLLLPAHKRRQPSLSLALSLRLPIYLSLPSPSVININEAKVSSQMNSLGTPLLPT